MSSVQTRTRIPPNDIHDVMVEIQQGKGTGGERAFVTQTVAGLKQFMDTIDFDGMLKNLGSALC